LYGVLDLKDHRVETPEIVASGYEGHSDTLRPNGSSSRRLRHEVPAGARGICKLEAMVAGRNIARAGLKA